MEIEDKYSELDTQDSCSRAARKSDMYCRNSNHDSFYVDVKRDNVQLRMSRRKLWIKSSGNTHFLSIWRAIDRISNVRMYHIREYKSFTLICQTEMSVALRGGDYRCGRGFWHLVRFVVVWITLFYPLYDVCVSRKEITKCEESEWDSIWQLVCASQGSVTSFFVSSLGGRILTLMWWERSVTIR